MYLPKKDQKKKTFAIIVGIVLALGVLGGGAYYARLIPGVNQDRPSKIIDGVNYSPATDEQKKASDSIKKDAVDKQYGSGSQTDGGNQQSGEAGKSVDVSITNHGSNNGAYQFRTLISTTNNGGTCTLTMTSPGHSDITKSTDVQVLGSYAVCASYFDIPLSQLGNSTWNATIDYVNGTSKGSTSIKVTAS